MFTDDISVHCPSPVAGAPHWSVSVTADFVALGATHYHADLFLWDEQICRISLKRRVADRAEAMRLLLERCRVWIARQESRPRIEETDFQVLPRQPAG
ncbi:MAG: hypothetical protein ABWZ88_15485 [Variovorax sp.]